MEYFVFYGESKIHYTLKSSKRKILGITVHPDGKIQVSAPNGISKYKIQETLIKKGAWIMNQLRVVSKIPPPETKRKALSGESYYFLGRQYRLKVFEANYDGVDIYHDRIIMNCPFPEEEELKLNLLKKWYFRQAHEVFTKRFQVHKNLFSKIGNKSEIKTTGTDLDFPVDSLGTPIDGLEKISLSIKKLHKSWGKYHPEKNKITLNVELVVAPMDCIDYVIIHELCHSKVLNHGKAFNALISSKMPNWKALKEKLENFSNGLESLHRGKLHRGKQDQHRLLENFPQSNTTLF